MLVTRPFNTSIELLLGKMVDRALRDQELATESTKTTVKVIRGNSPCAQRTIVVTMVAFVVGFVALLTASFLIVSKAVRCCFISACQHVNVLCLSRNNRSG